MEILGDLLSPATMITSETKHHAHRGSVLQSLTNLKLNVLFSDPGSIISGANCEECHKESFNTGSQGTCVIPAYMKLIKKLIPASISDLTAEEKIVHFYNSPTTPIWMEATKRCSCCKDPLAILTSDKKRWVERNHKQILYEYQALSLAMENRCFGITRPLLVIFMIFKSLFGPSCQVIAKGRPGIICNDADDGPVVGETCMESTTCRYEAN